jgi:hypothetical protein
LASIFHESPRKPTKAQESCTWNIRANMTVSKNVKSNELIFAQTDQS